MMLKSYRLNHDIDIEYQKFFKNDIISIAVTPNKALYSVYVNGEYRLEVTDNIKHLIIDNSKRI